MGLYIWLVIIVVAFVSLLCRRQTRSCMKDRSSALEMTTRFEIEDKLEQVEELNLDELQSLQPGLNLRTFATLQSEELLYPSVLAYLREEDLPALDISAAQRGVWVEVGVS
nr:hypothetical protein BaRGS_026739 [Batillaria attramentaria]